jgi:trans-aconitate methyltransferase
MTDYTYSHFTKPNRYPEIFSACSKLNPKAKHILSFGCSTGEECFALRSYFPDSFIHGTDLFQNVIDEAITKNTDPYISFSLEPPMVKFDIIFCMTVFCRHHPNGVHPTVGVTYKFEDFEKQLEPLVRSLNYGGCIVIHNSHFRFCETVYGTQFSTIHVNATDITPQFDKNNNRTIDQYSDCIFLRNEKIF